MTSGSQTEPLTADGAERLTARIRLHLDTIADHAEQVVPLIEEAKAANVHEALGYRSWTAYVSERFGGVLGRLDRSERRPLVLLLARQGMSTRAIGSVVGASEGTVRNDLAGAQDYAPGPVAGIDGKTYVRREPDRLPTNVTAVTDYLGGLDAIVAAKEWERAAIVAAFVTPQQGTVSDFAALGVAGLCSSNSVSKYLEAWASAVTSGHASEAIPGQSVTLPDLPFPPTEEGAP